MNNDLIDALILEYKRLQKAWELEKPLTAFVAGQIDALKTAIIICENAEFYLNKFKRNKNGN